jgi:hypothetical protein
MQSRRPPTLTRAELGVLTSNALNFRPSNTSENQSELPEIVRFSE